MRLGFFQEEAVPLLAMLAVEFAGVGLNIIFKAASARGLSYHVFIFYTYASALLILSPFAFFSTRSVDLPSNKLSFFFRLLCLAAIGVLAQICGYIGLEYSSPTLSSVIGNLTPAFTFILAVLFRMEKIDWESLSTMAKVVGTVVSMAGALVVVLYRGPILLSLPSSASQIIDHLNNRSLTTSSPTTGWVLGGCFFSVQYLCYAFWHIYMTKAIKIFPEEFMLLFMYYVCATALSAPVCFLSERNLSAWALRTDMAVGAVLYAGFVGQSMGTFIQAWCLRKKGPVYVCNFRPLSIVIAAVMGFVLLGDVLSLGSVIGGIVISIGFYGLLWGKANEETQKGTPLLQHHN